jgi:parallel beta-helix repeat protein
LAWATAILPDRLTVCRLLCGLVLALGTAGCGESPLAPAPEARCALHADPDGRDSASGSAGDPFRSVQTMVDQLQPGQTGCLDSGTYSEDVTFRRGGAPGRPVTLTSAPGTRAVLRGTLWITDTADYVVIRSLGLDGTTATAVPSPQVNGDRVVFKDNDVTNRHTAICFAIGGSFPRYGKAVATVIDGNYVHGCGRLPATNHDHGIYVEGARDTRITNNWIYDNADWGVHLYPDADETYVGHNVIFGNGGGVIVAGAQGGDYSTAYSSDDATIELNVITDSKLRSDLETSWQGLTGTGNVARRNCLGPSALPVREPTGLTLSGNVQGGVRIVGNEPGSLRLERQGACAALGAGVSP